MVELLENAIRHSETDAPHVAVDVRRVDDRIELTVTDDAAPIPPYDAEVLLGDHRMNDVYHSSGLGLWVVYWSVELSDGTISVDATEDRGNRIVVTLPAASSEPAGGWVWWRRHGAPPATRSLRRRDAGLRRSPSPASNGSLGALSPHYYAHHR
ncbi:sensor histidine kinase [Halobaculum litoreum]|uniref:histidine kinase n=1 Tax=Halobaculum litoreum TaxID=3031998 RepID=A0ABD5XRT8_9EURY